ncbi:DUF1641 domain-containing protein [Deinococcus sp.]|uniref:DUF1641 domain-containing protein n=1 Tax=Deinococcus sp. TaxID=47478 RepID=UPI0025FBF0DF|nr:DUF1641 domain-containing protein [Deinococcus sp.]
MAKPLDYTAPPKSPRQQIETAQEDSAEALTEALKLLRELHEAGVLNTVYKLTKGGSGLSSALLDTLSEDSSLTAIRNFIELTKTFGTLEPQALGQLGNAVEAGIREGARSVAQGKGVGLGELLKLLADRDVQVALGAVFGLLKGAGRALREAGGETQDTANQAEFGRHDQIQPTPQTPKTSQKPSGKRSGRGLFKARA